MGARDIGSNALPVGFRGHVERHIHAGTVGKIAGNRRAAGVAHRRHDGRADGAGSARHQDNFFLKVGHRHVPIAALGSNCQALALRCHLCSP